jgi:surfeit locus 1 family protein
MFGGGEGRDNWSEGWPKVVQRMEVERMAASVDAAAVEIRLEPDQPGVLTPPLMQMNMPAARHTAYAVQWFGLAVALLVGYVVFGLRRRHDR